jgi:hypothetical protein
MAILRTSELRRRDFCWWSLFNLWVVLFALLAPDALTLPCQETLTTGANLGLQLPNIPNLEFPYLQSPVPTDLEYQIKSVFLFNFAQFVEWPAQTFPEPQSPIIIAVLGDDPFGRYLDETVRGERVNNRPLVVRRYHRLEDVPQICHVLFIGKDMQRQLTNVFARLKGRNILTVADISRFARNGGTIQFTTEENKIRLEINVGSARAAGLNISSKLLRLARIIDSEKGNQ